MKKYLLAAVAALAIAAPATAKDGSIYVGIEGGIMKPKDLDGGAFVNILQTFNPTSPSPRTRFDPLNFRPQATFDDGFTPRLGRGYDIDAILGYDFGFLRLEGELGYKKANRKGFDASEDDLLKYVNGALNRPEGFPRPLPPLTDDDFEDLDGKITFRTTMINALVDLGNEDGLSFYAGGGGGRVWAAALNDKDKAFAYQLIAGARYAVSRNIDLGLKYRHFRTGRLNFEGGPVGVVGNDRILTGGQFPNFVDITLSRSAEIFPEFGGKYRTHSLLASLTFNFGRAELMPLPPPPPPPLGPPVPHQATRTCPDGTTILTTGSCPLPPPPLPAPERG